mmetsp:Transcript_34853/g.80273  ORF Transcript_34853/g.80273 Transcript_34853/m.80273 type:complete len:208 (+) Transcript_34853:398-1021(+)
MIHISTKVDQCGHDFGGPTALEHRSMKGKVDLVRRGVGQQLLHRLDGACRRSNSKGRVAQQVRLRWTATGSPQGPDAVHVVGKSCPDQRCRAEAIFCVDIRAIADQHVDCAVVGQEGAHVQKRAVRPERSRGPADSVIHVGPLFQEGCKEHRIAIKGSEACRGPPLWRALVDCSEAILIQPTCYDEVGGISKVGLKGGNDILDRCHL